MKRFQTFSCGPHGTRCRRIENVRHYHSMWVLTLIVPLCVHKMYTFTWLTSVQCYIHWARFPVQVAMMSDSFPECECCHRRHGGSHVV